MQLFKAAGSPEGNVFKIPFLNIPALWAPEARNHRPFKFLSGHSGQSASPAIPGRKSRYYHPLHRIETTANPAGRGRFQRKYPVTQEGVQGKICENAGNGIFYQPGGETAMEKRGSRFPKAVLTCLARLRIFRPFYSAVFPQSCRSHFPSTTGRHDPNRIGPSAGAYQGR